MAIIEMKRVSLLGMLAERDKLLRALQRAGCVQISEIAGEELSNYRPKDHRMLDSAEEKLTRIRWAISQLGRFEKKQGMLASMSMLEVDAGEAEKIAADEDRFMGIVEAIEGVERKSGELRGVEARLKVEIEQLSPWLSLPVPVEMLQDTRETIQLIGTVPAQNYGAMEAAFSGFPLRMECVNKSHGAMNIWIVSHKSAKEPVLEALRAADFSAVRFSGSTGTPSEQIDGLNKQLHQLDEKRVLLEEELKGYAGDACGLRVLYEMISDEKERHSAAAHFMTTGSAFLMEGWVPATACEKLSKKIKSLSVDSEVEFRDALDVEQPPTMLRNNRIFAPFETVVSNYSLPDPRGLDPTFIMAPFFACFFGMMVSDAGYGLVMAILIPLIIHFVKPKTGLKKMMWILSIGGCFTVFWGAMFDTWFGESLKPLLINPLTQPLEMLGLCLGMGVLHLFAALGIAAYMNFKRGKPLDAIFDQFLWYALLIGLGMMFLPQTSGIGTVMAIVGAVGIFLTAGRSRPNLIGKFTGGFGALYGVTSWISDILSYMRLFGMGLATGVIGMVINMLVGMILNKGVVGIVIGVPILIFGHLFNASINILGAYVHSCRLQYIEFFNKFYEEGGAPFSPLSSNPRYVAVRHADPDGVE